MVRMIFAFIIALILLLTLSWLNIKANRTIKKTRSIKKFTGTYPHVYRNILLGGLWFCTLVSFFFYAFVKFLSDMDTGAEMGHVVIFIAISGMCLIFWTVLILERLDVDNNTLRYRNMVGITRKTSVDKIEKIVRLEKSLDIYVGGKYFGAFSEGMLHQNNFYRWCEQKGVSIEVESEHPITKRMLYSRAIKDALKGGVSIGVFLAVLVLLVYFLTTALLKAERASLSLFFIYVVWLCSLF